MPAATFAVTLADSDCSPMTPLLPTIPHCRQPWSLTPPSWLSSDGGRVWTCPVAPRADRFQRRLAFVPRVLHPADDDAALVPLAGQEDGVAFAGPRDRVADRFATVDDAFVL